MKAISPSDTLGETTASITTAVQGVETATQEAQTTLSSE